MEERYSHNAGEHQLTIVGRRKMELTGVIHVESFDNEEIILETELGLLAIRGEDLHIKQLTLEEGELLIEGYIIELVYSEEKKMAVRGRSFLQRLFR